MNELEKIIHAILHALGLDHGIPTEVIETAKADASIAIKAVEASIIPVAEKAAESAIAAEVPPVLAPIVDSVVEGVVAAGETEAEKVVAPAATPEADARLSPDAPMVQV